MSATLVDSNVLLDLLTDGSPWTDWSVAQLDKSRVDGELVINDVIFAELSVRFPDIESLDGFLLDVDIRVAPIPREALFLAGKAFLKYRENQGPRTGILPDFLIGAHAAVDGYRMLTRDRSRYRTYFPYVELVTPQS